MMRRAITLAALIMFAAPASARPAACSTIDGAVIVADDGTYLGKVADAYDGKSIFNKYGTHGSPYSGNSVWNNYGPYGSEYSNQSARSKYTSTHPRLIVDGTVVGFLSPNKNKPGAIEPLILGRSEERRVGKECVSTGNSRGWRY